MKKMRRQCCTLLVFAHRSFGISEDFSRGRTLVSRDPNAVSDLEGYCLGLYSSKLQRKL